MSELSTLSIIQDNNSPTFAKIKDTDKIYNIDLNTRKIDSIDTIIVESDHKSQTLYFKVSRLFDNIDLANFLCVIEYINADKEKNIYIVPYYDYETFFSTNELCFAWEISQMVAKKSGKIEFAISFYKVSSKKFEYKINTLPQTFTIQNSIGFTTEDIRIEEQFVESSDTNFQENKTYYIKTVTDVVDSEGNIKIDATGENIKIISFDIASSYEEGKTYYEKIDLSASALENYSSKLFDVLSKVQQVENAYDLSWIVLE